MLSAGLKLISSQKCSGVSYVSTPLSIRTVLCTNSVRQQEVRTDSSWIVEGWFWKFNQLLDKFNRNALIFWYENNFCPIVENLLYAHSKILLWTRHQGNDFVSFSINTLVTMVLIQPTEGNLQQPSRTSVHLNRSYIMHCSVSCSNWDFRSIQLLTIKWYH